MISLTDVVNDTRQQLQHEAQWDVIVIGAGITGAGIAREAAQRGYRTLLLERDDFASGTSNFSSKMVHGGLRYLTQGHFSLTCQAARAREALKQRWPELVHPLPHYLLHQRQIGPAPWLTGSVLKLYHWLSGASAGYRPRSLSNNVLITALPELTLSNIDGAHLYFDALCDDSQLVLRTLQEAAAQGAQMCHYTSVEGLIREWDQVNGVIIRNQGVCRLRANIVINATGVWADGLCALPKNLTITPQRGSHLLFRRQDIPLPAALTLFHPDDKRVVFCYPWAGSTILGTTDLHHLADKQQPVRCSSEERQYLLKILPQLGIKQAPPIVCSWSGLRPIVTARDPKDRSPSAASREHLIWDEPGLVSVTGGKLTTFVEMATQVLDIAEAQQRLPTANHQPDIILSTPTLQSQHTASDAQTRYRELLYWAEHGAVQRLTDLLLRRTRLGWYFGRALTEYQRDITEVCRPILNWSELRWLQQWQDYWQHFERYHDEDCSELDTALPEQQSQPR